MMTFSRRTAMLVSLVLSSCILSSLIPRLDAFVIPFYNTPSSSSSSSRFPFLTRTVDNKNRQCQKGWHQAQNDDDDNDDYNDEVEDDDDDDEDDEPPEVSVANFQPPKLTTQYGLNRGHSAPSQRKAMGTSGKSTATVYVCTNCGSESVQWRGRCPTCREWNTLQEMAVQRSPNHTPRPTFAAGGGGSSIGSGSSKSGGGARSWLEGVEGGYNDYYYQRPISITAVDVKSKSQRLIVPHDEELNTVLGGGLLEGSLVLLGGDPGVGKSTLALQVAAQVAAELSTPPVGIGMGPLTNNDGTKKHLVGPVWYMSGEETLPQIAIRAERLEVAAPQLHLLAETNLNGVADHIVQLIHSPTIVEEGEETGQQQELPPSLLVIDSIQTMMCEAGGASSPGGIVQVRECMALLLRLAKSTQIPIVVIGHVTKAGDVAGPRMVEHMVDAVLYLEAGHQNYRWLRAQKNRFGNCQNVGLYEFQEGRLIPNPDDMGTSSLLMEDDLEGCAMAISVEGPHRAMSVEVQALVTVTAGSFGKKTVDGGYSTQRLQLIIGVLQKHCSVFMGKSRDVYINIVGGSTNKQSATSLDLAVALALTSSLTSIPVRGDTVCLAQVGLLGELRSLQSMEPRLMQAQRMGFSRVIVAGRKMRTSRKYGMEYIECPNLKEALQLGLTSNLPARKRRARPTSERSAKPSSSRNKPASQPASFEELDFDDVIMDDEDDEDDYNY